MKANKEAVYTIIMSETELRATIESLLTYIDLYEIESYEIDSYTIEHILDLSSIIDDRVLSKSISDRIDSVSWRCKQRGQ